VVAGPGEAADEPNDAVADELSEAAAVVVAGPYERAVGAAVDREHLVADAEPILVAAGQGLGSVAVHSFEIHVHPCLAEG